MSQDRNEFSIPFIPGAPIIVVVVVRLLSCPSGRPLSPVDSLLATHELNTTDRVCNISNTHARPALGYYRNGDLKQQHILMICG
ncbi:hypothetical protein DdX_03308 [Ditylenchus destructor]|uniref:Uncharacterized protein n=1 Tax=Ditylenchus destructor TaxID=166010 RepID=A0AAD4R6S9_9BILA|nr:hypothetical protein DdX_03308 [Ditylenchus destructor]